MPGAAPRTSSEALNNATLPFGLALANHGLDALKKDKHREAFVELVVAQQSAMGRYTHWKLAYEKRCRKKKVALTVLDGGKAA